MKSCLIWGEGSARNSGQSSFASPVAAVLEFSIRDASARPEVGRMSLRRPDDSATLRPVEKVEFGVALALSAAAMDEVLAQDTSPGAAQVRVFLNKPQPPPIVPPLTPGARLAVESIRRCPFGGACRAMALAARSHDLLFEFLAALSAIALPALPPATRALTAQIQAAAAALTRNLEYPPSLAELAREAGLSETTLKRGFQQVLGTTVFGYLHQHRMERARLLLAGGRPLS